MTSLRAAALTLCCAVACMAAVAQPLRPEVARPLQQAAELLKAGKPRDALAKVNEADKVAQRTPAEQLTIERMRGAAAQRAGDHATTIRAFERVVASGKLPAAEHAQLAESLAYAYAQTANLAKAQVWLDIAKHNGADSAQLRQLQAWLHAQAGDHAAVAREASAAIAAAEQAGRTPAEADLLRLADAQHRGKLPGYGATLEKLLVHHPKKAYWAAALARLARSSGFAERHTLDLLRLKLASGTLDSTEEFMEMAQLALQAGYPAEARQVVESGYASGALGTGAQAERHQRLRDMAERLTVDSRAGIAARITEAATAKDGNALVHAGMVQVTLGEVDRGIALVEQGIAKGGLNRPSDARLHLGIAQLRSANARAKAATTLRGVQGNDGVADIARLWLLLEGIPK